jgi:hypothetical protein
MVPLLVVAHAVAKTMTSKSSRPHLNSFISLFLLIFSVND